MSLHNHWGAEGNPVPAANNVIEMARYAMLRAAEINTQFPRLKHWLGLGAASLAVESAPEILEPAMDMRTAAVVTLTVGGLHMIRKNTTPQTDTSI